MGGVPTNEVPWPMGIQRRVIPFAARGLAHTSHLRFALVQVERSHDNRVSGGTLECWLPRPREAERCSQENWEALGPNDRAHPWRASRIITSRRQRQHAATAPEGRRLVVHTKRSQRPTNMNPDRDMSLALTRTSFGSLLRLASLADLSFRT